MKSRETLVLTQSDVASLLSLEECIAAVERAFAMHGRGEAVAPGILGMHAAQGGFHIKAGILELGRLYFAAKLNANFPQNPSKFGLPTIQGAIVLFDAENGFPLAIMDSIEITSRRTAAATAIAAKHLARRDASIATVCGCGIQGRVQMQALAKVVALECIYTFDQDANRARKLAQTLAAEIPAKVIAVSRLEEAVAKSHIIVTCTTAHEVILAKGAVPLGAFVAAVGADNPEKQEIDPHLLASSKVVVDVLEQALTIGDLHHAVKAGVMTPTNVHAELGEVVAGKKAGRTSTEEITVFDSTGMALQDVAATVAVFEKAAGQTGGLRISLAESKANRAEA